MTDVETKSDPFELVSALADETLRAAAMRALLELGSSAREAVTAGLGDGRWEVRRWCCFWLLQFAERSDFERLVPLVRDPRSRVRHAALCALAHASAFAQLPDVVPLLFERACCDESLRVRRQAVVALAWGRPHPDLEAFFKGLLETESDPKLCQWARLGIARSKPC